MRVCLMRTGTVFYADQNRASPIAGNQDAMGVLRYLKEHHDVCVFGQARGDFGCDAFVPDFRKVQMWEDPNDRLGPQIEALKAWKPDVCVNVVGACPTMSSMENPWDVRVQMWAKLNVGPQLHMMDKLNIPRICIVNDPRCIPRDHEMHFMNVRPVSILGQGDMSYTRTLRGEQQQVRCHDAKAENWWSYGLPYRDEPKQFGTVVVAHAHMTDNRLADRSQVWNDVLSGCDTNFTLYGKGWEETKWKDNHGGVIQQDAIQSILSRTVQGPMLPLQNGFSSGKLREYAIAGCMPRPITGELIYDSQAKYVPLDHESRIVPGERWGLYDNKDWVNHLREVSTPDFTDLERAMAGEKLGGIDAI